MWTDLRHAARRLGRDRLFTATAAVTLALGIGATTTIFAGIRAVALRPLPFPEDDRLIAAYLVWPSGARGPWSYPKLNWLRRESRTTDWAGVGQFPMTMARQRALPVVVETVTDNYFHVLGVRPLLGRAFRPEDTMTPGGDRFLILGHDLWRSEFGGDPAVVGSSVVLNKTPFEVVGVMPRGFVGHSGRAECWAPVTMTPLAIPTPDAAAGVLTGVHWKWLAVIGRLRPSATLAEARAEVATIHAAMLRAWPYPPDDDPHWRPLVLSLREAYSKPDLERSLALLQASVALVLLIACLNVAGMAAVRSVRYEGNVAIRQALGASPLALARLLVLEASLVAILGGLASLLVTVVGSRALQALAPADPAGGQVVPAGAIRLDSAVLALTALLTIGTTIAVSLLPMVHLRRVSLDEVLRREGGPSARGSFRLRPWRGRGLVIAGEIALAYSLVVGSWLLMKSFDRVVHTDPGFHPEHVLALRISVTDGAPPAVAASRIERLLDQAAGLPGVQVASLANCLPAARACFSAEVAREDAGRRTISGFHSVAPLSFQALGIRMIRGRDFAADDQEGAVAIVNARAARDLREDVLGHDIVVRGWGGPRRVIAVVEDAKYLGLDALAQPDVYVPAREAFTPVQYLVLRTEDPPRLHEPAVRSLAARLDRSLRVDDVRSMDERVADATSDRRFSAVLLAAFATVALFLAAVGTYATVSLTVVQGVREIAVRMALGATPGLVFRAVNAQVLWLASAGLVAGGAVNSALMGLARGTLFGVAVHDPQAYAGAATILAAMLALATFLPARAAAIVDPMSVLRRE
jgi:predicted permease